MATILGGNQAIPQHEQARRLPTDPPNQKDVRNAIERVTVGATRIEILLNELVVAEGLDRVLTLPWSRPSSCRRREIIQRLGKRSNPYEQCERKRETVSSKHCATLTAGSTNSWSIPPPDHRVARHPRGQKRALDPNDAVPCFHVPRSGGSRNGGSASARVLHQAPDRPSDALVRAMARHRTAGAGSGSSRTPLIHPAPFRAPRILLVVIGRRSASAPASPSRGPGNGILRAETGGRIQVPNAGERSEFGSQTATRLTNRPKLRGFLPTRKPRRGSRAEDAELRERAIKNRDLVAAMMTPDQIAEAQRMAREWKPK